MSTWAIVPIKPLNRSKSRLSSVLTIKQRAALSREMFERTLTTLRGVPGIDTTLVISRDSGALSLARQLGAQTLQERGESELNASLTMATRVAIERGATGVLLVASDIPLLQAEDVENMLNLGKHPPVVVIAADRRNEGTNAMLVRPPVLFRYTYGVGSLNRHREAALAAGAEVHIYQSLTTGLDVDIPADLDLYRELLVEQELHEAIWPVRM